jgi:hypothetical protein
VSSRAVRFGFAAIALALGAGTVSCTFNDAAPRASVCSAVDDLQTLAPDLAAGIPAHDDVVTRARSALAAIAAAAPGNVAAAANMLAAALGPAGPGSPGSTLPGTTAPAAVGSTPGAGAGSVPDSSSAREALTVWALDTCAVDPFVSKDPGPTRTGPPPGSIPGTTAPRVSSAPDWEEIKTQVRARHPNAGWFDAATDGSVAVDPSLGISVVVFGPVDDSAMAACRDVQDTLVASHPPNTPVRVRVRGPVGSGGAATGRDGTCQPFSD